MLRNIIKFKLKYLSKIRRDLTIKSTYQNILQSQYEQFHESNQLIQDKQINLQLIDDTIKQKSKCYAIALNKTGSQLVSVCDSDIKVWNMIDGKLNYQSIQSRHTNDIYCLIYSKKYDSFISSSKDKTIICWKQIIQNEWKASQQYIEHKGWIGTMILNNEEIYYIQQEKINKQQFGKQILIKMNQHLYINQKKHTNCIHAMNLNECENILITSGDDQQIIIWEFGQEDKYYFRQVLNQVLNYSGCHIKFINNDKFIWISSSKDINCICDYKNDCSTIWIFGTTTDDGKYLLFLGNHQGGYSLYELQYK